MKKHILSTFALLSTVVTVGQTVQASTQLKRAFRYYYQNETTWQKVREESSKITSPPWKSTGKGETQQFEGYFIATSPGTKLAVRSDDGVNIFKNGEPIWSGLNTDQHWPREEAFADLGGGWTQNVPYKVVVDYKNTKFSGNDADGVILMNYNGTGKLVTVDLVVGGVDEDLEEKEGVFLGVNAPVASATTAETDTDLKNATLQLQGQGESGTWSLAIPTGLKVWQQVGATWQPVVNGQQSSPVTLPASISLRVEGVQTGVQELTGNLRLTSPQAAQAIGDKAKVTVVGVQIQKSPSSFVPLGGSQDNTVQLTVTVTPSTIKGKFRFTLFETSSEPGYCLNAPLALPATGENSAAWKDLQFPAQTGLTLSASNSVAETTANNLSAKTITVKCYDYGAYSKLGVRLILPNNTEFVAKEAGGTKAYTNIPLDDNDNHIADGTGQNVGPGTSNAATDDNDNTPTGAGVDGDGIARYEEYRGFLMRGVHTRLSTLKKDVFFRNVDVTDAGNYGFFTETNLTAPTHSVTMTEYIDSTRVVNFHSRTAHVDDQQAIRITQGNLPPPSYPTAQGLTLILGGVPAVPNNQISCEIFVGFIKRGTTLSSAISITDTNISVASTNGYLNAGTIRIGAEEIAYTSLAGNIFQGCLRGANGTVASAHANGAKVNYYANEADQVKNTFTHEAGHVVELKHPPTGVNDNIMSGYARGGTIANGGIATRFITPSYNAIVGQFRVRN